MKPSGAGAPSNGSVPAVSSDQTVSTGRTSWRSKRIRLPSAVCSTTPRPRSNRSTYASCSSPPVSRRTSACSPSRQLRQRGHAQMPAGGEARRAVAVAEGVDEGEQRALAVRGDLPAQMVLAPGEGEDPRLVRVGDGARHRRFAVAGEQEAHRPAGPELHGHLGGEPLGEVRGLGDRVPDPLRRMREPALHPQRGPAVRRGDGVGARDARSARSAGS